MVSIRRRPHMGGTAAVSSSSSSSSVTAAVAAAAASATRKYGGGGGGGSGWTAASLLSVRCLLVAYIAIQSTSVAYRWWLRPRHDAHPNPSVGGVVGSVGAGGVRPPGIRKVGDRNDRMAAAAAAPREKEQQQLKSLRDHVKDSRRHRNVIGGDGGGEGAVRVPPKPMKRDDDEEADLGEARDEAEDEDKDEAEEEEEEEPEEKKKQVDEEGDEEPDLPHFANAAGAGATDSIDDDDEEENKNNNAGQEGEEEKKEKDENENSNNQRVDEGEKSANEIMEEREEAAAAGGEAADDDIKDNNNENEDERQKDAAAAAAEADRHAAAVAAAAAAAAAREEQKKKKDAAAMKKHGTGPTTVGGLVMDLLSERNEEVFRDGPLPDTEYYRTVELQVASQTREDAVTSCRRAGGRDSTVVDPLGRKIVAVDDRCLDSETPLIAYNGDAAASRIVCGRVLPPGAAVKMDDHCDEPAAHLFPVDDVPVSGEGLPAVQVQDHPLDRTPADQRWTDIGCDVPCQFAADMAGVHRFVVGTPWTIGVTDKNPAGSPGAKVERISHKRDAYYSTTSRDSSVPLSFYDAAQHSVRDRPALDWSAAGNSASYFIDGRCGVGDSKRDRWHAAVQAAFPVSNYGKCKHNADLGAGETVKTAAGRVRLAKKHRMHLAFEESTEKDHFTAVTYEALLSGAVPVIRGPANAASVLPRNCCIFTSLYNSWDKLALYVKEVSEDEQKWMAFHAWRDDEAEIARYEAQFEFAKTTPECRTCRWAHAKRYGLGWDHGRQVVRANAIPRRLCVDQATKLVTQPFRETWLHRGEEQRKWIAGDDAAAAVVPAAAAAAAPTLCSPSLTSEMTITMDDYVVRRTVAAHDGVIDMILHEIKPTEESEHVILRLGGLAVQNERGAYFRDVHTAVSGLRHGPAVSSATVQDRAVKVTVLANWNTKITASSSGTRTGTIEIGILNAGEIASSKQETRRLRIITEDADALHHKLTEYYPSHYSKLMIRDFVDPVEYFYADGSSQ